MSILDGLDTYGPAGVESYGDTNSEWYRREDVREALTNPTDEQLEAIALAVWDKALGVGVEEVRAVLAAAAGGDR